MMEIFKFIFDSSSTETILRLGFAAVVFWHAFKVKRSGLEIFLWLVTVLFLPWVILLYFTLHFLRKREKKPSEQPLTAPSSLSWRSGIPSYAASLVVGCVTLAIYFLGDTQSSLLFPLELPFAVMSTSILGLLVVLVIITIIGIMDKNEIWVKISNALTVIFAIGGPLFLFKEFVDIGYLWTS